MGLVGISHIQSIPARQLKGSSYHCLTKKMYNIVKPKTKHQVGMRREFQL